MTTTQTRPSRRRGTAPGGNLRREVGLVGLTFISLGSIIGSGWLLGALGAAKVAGPASLVSWGLGAVIIVVLALIHAELGAAYPVQGGTTRFPAFVFGPLAGFTSGWMGWLGSVTLAPIEVEAALQYLSNEFGGLVRVAGTSTVLTGQGLAVAVVLMAAFTVINIAGVKWLSETNKLAVWWKVAVPLLTIVALMGSSFHAGNFHAGGGFAPFGVRGVFEALPAGIVFSLMGFEQAVQLGGEAREPGRNIPRAVIGSMAIGTVIYLLLEVAFIGALDPANLVHGWADPITKGSFGPYAGLATSLGLGWLAFLLYADAFVSPAGTGLVYTGTTSRISYAMSRSGYLPAFLGRLNARGIPLASALLTFVVGLVLFLPFPSWQQFVGFVTSATVLMYAFAPISFAVLRRCDPDRERPYRMPAGAVLSRAGFAASNLIVYWTGWQTDEKLFLAALAGFALLGLNYLSRRTDRPRLDWRPALWLAPYLLGMALISYLGQYGGGTRTLPFWADITVVAVFSLAVFELALRLTLSDSRIHANLRAAFQEDPSPAPVDGIAGRAG